MSSARNHSVQVLHGALIGQAMYYQLLHEQFKAQKTRFLQRPDQTGALTTEQQHLNRRVSAVYDDFMATARQVQTLARLFDGYNRAQADGQPKLRNQIQTMIFDETRPMFRNLAARLKELQGIKK